MPKKKAKTGKPQVHEELKGLELKINEFGEIKSNMDVDQINRFLNQRVDDKKFRERDDADQLKKGKLGKKLPRPKDQLDEEE